MVLGFIGLFKDVPHLAEDSGSMILLRCPWNVLLRNNALAVLMVWFLTFVFILCFPPWIYLPVLLVFIRGLVYPALRQFGVPETIRFDLGIEGCTYTHGWFGTARKIARQDIAGFFVRTVSGEGGETHSCCIKWNKNTLRWSEISSAGTFEAAAALASALSRKTKLPVISDYNPG